MTRRNSFRNLLACLALVGIGIFPVIALAQDAVKISTTDTKIRNIDGVAAIVNTGYVTRKEVDDRIAALQKQGNKMPSGTDLRKMVMDRLIIEKIQLQNAEQEGVEVTNKELDKIIDDIAAKNKMSRAELKVKIEASGTTYERYKQLLREDIVISRYREREVEGKVKISDAEIDNYIKDRNLAAPMGGVVASTPVANGAPEEIDVAQIFIPAEAGAAAQADAKKKAESLLVLARGDADFLQLGAMAAKDNPKIKFQELGYRTPDRLPQLFYEAVRNIGSGQVANVVVKSPAGFHVLKVLDRRALVANAPESRPAQSAQAAPSAPQSIMITQTLSRHILLRSRQGLSDQDAERRLAGYRDQVRAKTVDFGDLAKKYSEDGAAANGGNLGWMSSGDLVPEFEQAMNRLQIGDVSNPVKTQFGWHLIQVLDRREAQLTVEKQREFARAAIRERKFDQAYQDWLRELRDTATVKIINADDPASSPR
ncbi:periplasmic chaperone for outer membrane proteins SurA [Polynucleobacter meluiroseus]|uniref:Chaperone SurA n=1 Tax=Polynucleobacter meluiroseus TaxID=1938814 RepID=A0A240DXG5_9BURK|nr:peptidylprolyl isomerase [Polynucleobacter meluiroseus]SNX27885.1 periplasmic chaperone for outer membrane proteins SurA [Polynucleobacter meluiroseus]